MKLDQHGLEGRLLIKRKANNFYMQTSCHSASQAKKHLSESGGEGNRVVTKYWDVGRCLDVAGPDYSGGCIDNHGCG